MTNVEKVIKGLEECAGNGNCTKCQYGKEKQALSCKKLLADALKLIKSSRLIHTERALYTTVEIIDSDGGKTHWYVCGECKSPINPGDRYCHECGQAVKWE